MDENENRMCNKNRPLDNVMSVVEEVRQIFEFNIITIKIQLRDRFIFSFFSTKYLIMI